MRAIRFITSIALILAFFACATDVNAGSFTFKGRQRNYLIKTPKGPRKPMGMMICLHCNGGNPGTIIGRWTGIVMKDNVMCVAPSASAGSVNPWRDNEHDGIEFFRALVDHVGKQYKIDRKRIYMCGYSAGSCHTMRIGIPNSDFFAGLIGYSGSSMQGLGPRKIPVVSIHGTNDRTIKIDGTIRLHETLENAGWPHKLFKIQGGGHEYNASHDKEAWEFLKKNPPKDPPEVIAKRALEEGEEELKKKRYGKAYKAFQEALKTGALTDEANAAITELIENGEKEIEKAADNKKALKKIQSRYKGTPVADKAKAAIEKLAEKPKPSPKKTKPAKKDQPGKAASGKKADDDMFSPAMLLKRAEEYYRNEAYEPARNVLGRIIREYPDSKEARRAKYLLKKIEEEDG